MDIDLNPLIFSIMRLFILLILLTIFSFVLYLKSRKKYMKIIFMISLLLAVIMLPFIYWIIGFVGL